MHFLIDHYKKNQNENFHYANSRQETLLSVTCHHSCQVCPKFSKGLSTIFPLQLLHQSTLLSSFQRLQCLQTHMKLERREREKREDREREREIKQMKCHVLLKLFMLVCSFSQATTLFLLC